MRPVKTCAVAGSLFPVIDSCATIVIDLNSLEYVSTNCIIFAVGGIAGETELITPIIARWHNALVRDNLATNRKVVMAPFSGRDEISYAEWPQRHRGRGIVI